MEPKSRKQAVQESSEKLIHHSLRREATQIGINWGMDKLWYSHTMEYYSAIKKKTVDIPNNMDKSKKNKTYVKQKKQDTKEYTLFDSTYLKFKTTQINPWR